MSTPHYAEGSAYCEDCAPDGAQPGFFAETDTPEHCATCGELLDTNLTSDGMTYVDSAIRDFLSGSREDGDGKTILSWAQRWFPQWVDRVRNEMDTRPVRGAAGNTDSHLWNALSLAIDALKEDMKHLPQDLVRQREATLVEVERALEEGKAMMLPGYRRASILRRRAAEGTYEQYIEQAVSDLAGEYPNLLDGYVFGKMAKDLRAQFQDTGDPHQTYENVKNMVKQYMAKTETEEVR